MGSKERFEASSERARPAGQRLFTRLAERGLEKLGAHLADRTGIAKPIVVMSLYERLVPGRGQQCASKALRVARADADEHPRDVQRQLEAERRVAELGEITPHGAGSTRQELAEQHPEGRHTRLDQEDASQCAHVVSRAARTQPELLPGKRPRYRQRAE